MIRASTIVIGIPYPSKDHNFTLNIQYSCQVWSFVFTEKVGGSSSKDVEIDDNDVDEDDDGDLNVFEERTPAKQDKVL